MGRHPFELNGAIRLLFFYPAFFFKKNISENIRPVKHITEGIKIDFESLSYRAARQAKSQYVSDALGNQELAVVSKDGA